jgi:phage shock protein E
MKKITVFVYLFYLVGMFTALPVSAESGPLKTIDEIKREATEGIKFLSNEQLLERIKKNPKLVLIDVRTQREFQAGHLRGAAWVERGIVEFVLARTLADKQAEIIVYCKKGYRSSLVVKALRNNGYKNVKAHAGFDEWVLAGNTYMNYLGESTLVKPAALNAATFKPDYYQPKQ